MSSYANGYEADVRATTVQTDTDIVELGGNITSIDFRGAHADLTLPVECGA
jgi:hypothetical protein